MRRLFSAIGTLLAWLFIIALLAICLGPIVGSSIYLDRHGIVGPGKVVSKSERISPESRSNSWLRRLSITVSYEPRDQSWSNVALIDVDVASYDQLRPGSNVRVRYQPTKWLRQFPFVAARLEQQSTLSFLSVFAYNDWQPLVLGLLAIAFGMSALGSRSLPARLVLVTLFGVTIVALVIFSIRPAIFFDRGAPRLTATATVRNIDHLTIEPGNTDVSSQELLQPFDRVELEFDPGDSGGMVVAVDEIDAGSWPGLQVGASVPVTYPQGQPRAAQIAGVTRNHRVINWLMLPLDFGIYIGGIALILAIGAVARIFTRRRAQRSSQGQSGP